MALLVAIAGGLVGSIFGAPQLGFLAGSLLGSLLFGGSGRGGPKLTDLHVSSSTYGKPIIWGWGTARIGGNVIQAGDLVPHKHSQGGKGLGGGGTSYTYSATSAVALCSTEFTGPIKNVLKIWADTKLVYDATGQSGVTKNIPGSGGGKGGGGHGNGSAVVNGAITNAFNKVGHFRVYYGTQDQLPDAALEALLSDPTDQVPYRGMAYVVFDDIDYENYGNRAPNWTFEVTFANDTQQFSQNGFKINFNFSTVGVPATGNVALDSFRQRAYFFREASPNAGIHVIDLSTGNEIKSDTWTNILGGFAGSGSLATNGPIVGDDGFLYVWSSQANYSPWLKIDPDSLRVVDEFGTPRNLGAPNDGAVTLPRYVIPLQFNHQNYLLSEGIFSDMFLVNMDGRFEAANAPAGSLPANGIRLAGGQMTGSNTANTYGLLSVGGNLGVYQVGAGGSTAPHGGTLGVSLIGTSKAPADFDSLWTGFFAVTTFLYDATDNNVMYFAQASNTISTAGHHQAYLVKISTTTGEFLWKMPYDKPGFSQPGLPGNPDYGTYQTIIASGNYSWIDSINADVWSVNTQSGVPTITHWGAHLFAGYQAWVDSFGAILFQGYYDNLSISNEWGVLVTNQSGQGQNLGTIVKDICHAVGFVDADLNVTALTDTVEGYILDNQMLAADALRPLATAFLFDGVESDYTLKFVKRGGSSIVTVPSTDLAYLDKNLNQIVNETRQQEVDLPNNISLNFLDPNHNYQTGTQYARRPAKPYPTMYSKASLTQNLPIVAEPGFMKQLAEKLLFTAWIERVSYKTHLPWNYLPYDPTDIMTLTLTDSTQIVTRFVNESVGADMTIEANNVSESAPTYTSTATADGGIGFNQQQLALSTATRLFLLDIPLLRDIDDTGQSFTIMYDGAASYGAATPWNGTTIGKSYDDINFIDQPPIPISNEAIYGSAVNALGDVTDPFIIDNTNTLTVSMVNGGSTLASATLLEVCNGANAGVLINNFTGEVEIIQWTTVTTNTDGTYTLSGLLRGRRGTDVYTGTHRVGDTFIVCDPAHLSSIKMSLGDIGQTLFYRAVPNQTLVEDANVVPFADTGRTWKPYAPVQQTATLSGSDIDLAWVRRTRVGGELMPYTGIVPLAEQFESYEVDIYNALGNTVLRTLRVDYGAAGTTTPGVTYLAAQIASDFGSTPTQLWIAVYQISANVGRGFGKKVLIQVN